jgi:nicotinamide-nucleotide amidase
MEDDLAARATACCERIASSASRLGVRIAVAESLTGGNLTARLSATRGASSWFLGGIVAYARSVKHEVLSVPLGPVVSPEAALAMAEGAFRLFGADAVVSVTGVGGPGEQDGRPVGTVFLGFCAASREGLVVERCLSGSPSKIVEATVLEALELLRERLER